MKSTRKKKVLLLTLLSSLIVAASAVAVALSSGNKLMKSSAGTEIPASVSYSGGSTGRKTIATRKFSFLKTTGSGTNIYLCTYSSFDIGNSLVASFGGTYSSNYLTFTKDDNGEVPFIFQNVNSITITSASTSQDGATFDIFTATNASSPAYSGTIDRGETKQITDIDGANYIKLVPTSSRWLDISNVTLNYSCDPSVTGKVLLGIDVSGTPKKNYAQGSSFVAPTVNGHYIEGDVETFEPVEASFSGYDLSTLGAQTVTASYGGKTTKYSIHVKPTETSVVMNYYGIKSDTSLGDLSGIDLENSNLPAYIELGEQVNFSVSVFSGNGFMYFYPDESALEIWDQIQDPTSSTQTITMPQSGYTSLSIGLQYSTPVVEIEFNETPKDEYTVGSDFVAPEVCGVESNGSRPVITSGLTFSGFDSSEAVEGQVITVSYAGVESIQYSINIVEGAKPATSIVGSFRFDRASSDNYYLTFENDGSGTYRRVQPTLSKNYVAEFTYTYNNVSGAITITLTGFSGNATGITDFYNGYRPFSSGTAGAQNTTAKSVSSTDITITLYKSGSLDGTYTFQKVVS